MSSNLIRWSGLAAILGGALWVVKASVIMLGGSDPGLFVPAQFFFAVGLLGLHTRLAGRGGLPGRLGGFLAYAAVVLSFVNALYSLLFAERGPQTPFPFNVSYAVAGLANFLGLVLLGLAALRADILPRRWRVLPLTIGLLALLPVWVLAYIHLELPVVVLGLAWMLLGYLLWSESREPVQQPQRVR